VWNNLPFLIAYNIFLWTRKHGLSGATFKVLEILVKYFKLYFDIKVKHFIADAPYHILTSLRILRSQPQGGIIPVNLATRLTRNLKTSQEIFIGTLAKIPLTRNNFCQMNTITVTGIKCLSQELNVCHKNIIPVIRIIFMSKEHISCHRNTFQVTRKFACHKDVKHVNGMHLKSLE
jgi:hypothetical protein